MVLCIPSAEFCRFLNVISSGSLKSLFNHSLQREGALWRGGLYGEGALWRGGLFSEWGLTELLRYSRHNGLPKNGRGVPQPIPLLSALLECKDG